jgi:hypothetical protein
MKYNLSYVSFEDINVVSKLDGNLVVVISGNKLFNASAVLVYLLKIDARVYPQTKKRKEKN